MKTFFKKNPFVFILIPFLLGILCSNYFSENFVLLNPFILLIISALCVVFWLVKSYRLEWIFGALCFGFLFFYGAFRMKTHFQNVEFTSKEDVYVAKIQEIPVEKPNSYSTILKILQVKDSIVLKTDCRVIAYLQKSPTARNLQLKQEIIFKGRLQKVLPNPNPFTFNYAKYLSNRHLHYQVYIKEENLSLMKNSRTNFLKNFSAKKWQQYFIKKIHTYVPATKEKGIILAMLLGYRAELSPEIKEAFSHSGAMHVLAVSGLHMGILFYLITFVFKPLRKHKFGKGIYVIVAFSLIWLYAAITGFSPSVSRAAAMFSVIIVGSLFRYKKSVYNSIAISAFGLLLYEPHMLFYVGFQFSYIAVLSIVFFQPYLSKIFVFSNKIMHYLWQLTTVSVAAQIGVFPLSILYFHQFSNLFLLTNLVAINATLLLLWAGFAFLIFSEIHVFATYIGKGLNYMLIYFNRSIFFIDSLPNSTSHNLQFSPIQVLLIYSLIILLSIYFIFKKRKVLFGILGVLIVFLTLNFYTKIKQKTQQYLIFYSIKNKTALQYINGTYAYLVVDSTVNQQEIRYNIKDTWLRLGVKNKDMYVLKKDTTYTATNFYISDNFLFINDLKIIFLNNSNVSTLNIPGIDYVIVNKNSRYEYLQNIRAKNILLGSSLSYYKNKNWKSFLEQKNLSYISVSRQQAHMKRLK